MLTTIARVAGIVSGVAIGIAFTAIGVAIGASAINDGTRQPGASQPEPATEPERQAA